VNSENRRFWNTWRPVWIGALVSVPLIPLVVFLGGAGHGTLVPLIALFPFAPLAALKDGPFATCDLCGLAAAVVQLPLYGFLISVGARLRHLRFTGLLVALIHIVGIYLAVPLYR
jgi:hypothetical protein